MPSILILVAGLLTTSAARASDAPATSAARPPLAPGTEVLNFSLLDYHGKNYDLRRTDARAVVLFFTAAGCPIARQNAPKLQALADQFGGQGVAVWMVNATPQNDPGDAQLDLMFELGGVAPRGILGDRYPVKGMRGLVQRSVLGDPETLRRETLETLWGPYPLPPVLRDRHQLVTRYFGVTRTCDTIAIDTKSNTIFYRGAIDDQFTEGARKPKANKHYLADALAEFLGGKPVATPATKPHGCAVTFIDDAANADEPVSYTKQIAPLLQQKCVTCHSPGNIAPFAMTSHQKVKGWSAMIREVVLDRRMPPWHADPDHGAFAHDRSLTGHEARALIRWLDQGCPNDTGDAPDPLAAPPPPAKEWALGKPDLVVGIPRQEIPATGTVDYRYLDGDLEMPHDAWLRAAVTRPGNPRVIHHVIVRVKYPSGGGGNRPGEAYLFTTWVPGLTPAEYPAGTGVFLPKGARFNFEIHYTTTGEPQSDATEVGLYLAQQPPKMRLESRASETRALDIPPGAADARHTTMYAFKRDATLYELSPHMHVRGAWFRFDLLTPDGRRETLLSVPNYDFNWQTSYRLARPRPIAAGSWLVCSGGFDNSPRNPHNPDPTKRVRWGPQSSDEMFMGFFTVAEQMPEAPATRPAGR